MKNFIFCAVPSTVIRNNEYNDKATGTNKHLRRLCIKIKIYLIDHSKIIKSNHLNSSKDHLIRTGSNFPSNLGENFIKPISNTSKRYLSVCRDEMFFSVDAECFL